MIRILRQTKAAMNKYVYQHRLRPGDEIVLPKSAFNLVQHYAVYLGEDNAGTSWIVENKQGHGVKLTKADDFFPAGGSVTRINRFTGSALEREALVKKALDSVGRSYHLINFNCEHFSTELRSGRARSRQVEKVGWGVFLLVVAGALFSNGNRGVSRRRR